MSVTPDYGFMPLGYFQVTLGNTAANLYSLLGSSSVAANVTTTIPGCTTPNNVVNLASIVQIVSENADIRFTDDGTAPNTSYGFPIYQKTTYPYTANLEYIQLCSMTTNTTLDLIFYV